MSLSTLLTEWVTYWVTKLKISVNIDARTLKFGMEYPWAYWLLFKKNQFVGPCEDHVLVIKGPYFGHFFGKWTMGYTQNYEIWHGASLGTLIKIQEEPIWRTMWGTCFGHRRAIFWPFLGKGAAGYTQQCEIWHGTSLGTLTNIQEEPLLRAMWGPYFSHKGPYFCHF